MPSNNESGNPPRCASYLRCHLPWLCRSVVVITLLAAVTMIVGNTGFAATTDAASAFVQKTAVKAIDVLSNTSLQQSDRRTHFRKIILKTFDVPAIGRFVLGAYWSKASPDQQKRFLDVFEGALADIYIERFFDYDGHTLKLNGARVAENGATLVQSTVATPTGRKVYSVEWLVTGSAGKELFLDVVIDGVSTTMTTQQDYASVLRATDGNLDELVSRLQAKAQ